MDDKIRVWWIKGDFLTKEDKQNAESKGLKTEEAILLPITQKDRFFSLAIVLKNLVDNSNMGAKWEVNERVIIEIKRLVNSLNYLINSTSFQKGNKYYDFDREELNRKLGRK